MGLPMDRGDFCPSLYASLASLEGEMCKSAFARTLNFCLFQVIVLFNGLFSGPTLHTSLLVRCSRVCWNCIG